MRTFASGFAGAVVAVALLLGVTALGSFSGEQPAGDYQASGLSFAGGTLTGALLLPAGSAAAPALSTSGDTDTGIIWPGANELGFVRGGSLKWRINASGITCEVAGGPVISQGGAFLPSNSDLNTYMHAPASDTLALTTGGADALTATATAVTIAKLLVTTKDADTIADNGGGTPATHTLAPTGSYVELTCSDGDGCTITLSETGALEGARVLITNVSANSCTFADSAGVLELDGGAGFTMTDQDSLELLYTGDEWIELGRMDID